MCQDKLWQSFLNGGSSRLDAVNVVNAYTTRAPLGLCCAFLDGQAYTILESSWMILLKKRWSECISGLKDKCSLLHFQICDLYNLDCPSQLSHQNCKSQLHCILWMFANCSWIVLYKALVWFMITTLNVFQTGNWIRVCPLLWLPWRRDGETGFG